MSASAPAGTVPHQQGKLETLQACRAMAAILVVIAHTSVSIFDRPRYWPANPVGDWLDFGQIGVQFFFVLSGFIILTVHWQDVGRPAASVGFLRKRFIRIYPIYWLMLAALLAIYFAVPSFGEGFERTPDIIVSSALLIGWRVTGTLQPVTILPAAWTLYYEILFYALFVTLIWRRRVGMAVLASWFALSGLDLLFGPVGGPAALYISPFNLLFLMGLASAWLVRTRTIPVPAALAVLGFAVFFAGGVEMHWHALSDAGQSLVCGLGSMLAVLGLAALERRQRLVLPRWLVVLGEASYAIYLVHLSVLVLLAKLLAHFAARDRLPLGLWYLLFVVVAVAAGTAVHLLIERPLLAALRFGRRGRRAQVAS